MNTTINAFGRIALAVFLSTLLAVTAATANAQVKPRGFPTKPAAAAVAPVEKPAETLTDIIEKPAETLTDIIEKPAEAEPEAAAEAPAEAAETEEEAEPVDPVIEKLDHIVGKVSGGIVQGYDLQRHTNAVVSNMQQNTGVTRQGMSALKDEDARIRKNLRVLGKMLLAVLILLAALVVVMALLVKRLYRRGIVPALVIGLFSLGLVSQTYAAPATPCSIRSISSGSIIVKEQEASKVNISVRNCADVKSLEVATTGITITDVAQKGNVVTAKMAANASSQTGPAAFKLTMADGSEVVSETASFLIVDMATAEVRNQALSAVANVSKDVKAVTAKLRAELAARPTKTEVQAMISPLQAQVTDIKTVVASLLQESMSNAARVAGHEHFIEVLAENDVAFGNTKVKKGFWGGAKPLNPEAAEAAARILSAVGNTAELEPIVEAKQQ